MSDNENKISPTILKSIFNRKGSEGHFTKIIDRNKLSDELLLFLVSEEEPIVLYSQKNNRVLITNQKVVYKNSTDKNCIIDFNLIKSVKVAFEEELKDRVLQLKDYSRVKIVDKNDNSHILQIEKGGPYNGIYQVLHFISTRKIDN